MRFREEKPEDLDRARAAVAQWREKHPAGSREQMLTALSPEFHRDYRPVLGAVLSVYDRHHPRLVTVTGNEQDGPTGPGQAQERT